MTETIVLSEQRHRYYAMSRVGETPLGHVVTIREAKRSLRQNALMWALIHDVARAEPMGRKHTPDEWKAIFMQACGWEVHFLPGLSGEFFPVGFRSSKLTVKQMAELCEFILAFGGEHGIIWSDLPEQY